MKIGDLINYADTLRDRVLVETAVREREKSELLSAIGELSATEKSLLQVTRAIDLMASFADKGQREMVALIERVVSVGMTEVFGKEIKLKAEIVEKRGAQGLSLYLMMDGERREFNQVGGGYVDVLGFIMQVAVVKLVGAAPVLFLDEPFSHVSKNFLPRVSELVSALSSMMGLQIVIVTHETQLISGDKIYRFANDSGRTVVTDESED